MPGDTSFNAFNGVFVPTFLSIVGVILFLRLGRIVGSTGLLGTLIIISIAVSVIIATGLSLSTITTNIQIGKGGAYSIISKTLGLEVGGSVGIPLYLAHVFSVALYVFGFAEAWQYIYPSHPITLVAVITLAIILSLIGVSTKATVRTQEAVFLLVCASLLSVYLGGSFATDTSLSLEIQTLVDSSFWSSFALFFPATTGLMAGIALSGELEDPKRQIPLGLLWAVGLTASIYIFTSIWLSATMSYDALLEQTLVMAEQAWNGGIVVAGILAATFSSALTTALAAPRLLEAMADNRVLPASSWLTKRWGDVPLPATALTGLLLLALVLVGSLDTVAPILTVFFLLTYAVINLVVFLEQSLGTVSFRPTMHIPQAVSLYGAVGSLIIIFLINAAAGLASLVILGLIYDALLHRDLKETDGDVRSGVFRNVAEWASRYVVALPESRKHTWKPSVLLPVTDEKTVLGSFPLIRSIVSPNGTMTVLGIRTADEGVDGLEQLVDRFDDSKLFTSTATVDAPSFTDGVTVSMEAMTSQVFQPNIAFLVADQHGMDEAGWSAVFDAASKSNTGLAVLDRDDELGLGSENNIHVWIDERSIDEGLGEERPYDLAMLLAYRLKQNWAGTLNVHTAANNAPSETARRYLETMLYEGRFPHSTDPVIHEATDEEALAGAERGDLHIVPVTGVEDFIDHRENIRVPGKTYLYTYDSGKEDILG